MDAIIRRAETLRAPRSSARLPFLLSLAIHAAFGSWVVLAPSAPPEPESPPCAIDTNITRAEPRWSLAFQVEPGGSETSENRGEPSSAPLPSVRVNDPPPSTVPAVVPVPSAPSVFPWKPTPEAPSSARVTGSEQQASGAADVLAPPALLTPPRQTQSVVYVLDRSTSMGLSGAWDVARQWVLASLARLPDTARFQVIYYDRSPQLLCGQGRYELVPATLLNLQLATERLEALHAGGGTKHLPALTTAVELDPDVIFLLTDGEEMTAEEVRLLTRRNRRAVLHVLELTTTTQEHGGGPLQALAAANRGVCQVVNIAREPTFRSQLPSR
jgi:hypothetical protein